MQVHVQKQATVEPSSSNPYAKLSSMIMGSLAFPSAPPHSTVLNPQEGKNPGPSCSTNKQPY